MSFLSSRRSLSGKSGEEVELRGFVKKVMFSKPDFTAAVLETNDGEVSFRGNFSIRESDSIILRGKWTEHPKYGMQVQAFSFSHDQELTASGLERHLAEHEDMRGIIGPARARKLAEAFGDNFAHVVVEQPERIAEVAGIRLERALEVKAAWLKTKDENEARVELYGYGLTARQVAKLEEKFKLVTTAAKFVRDDPYHLVHEVSGFGFKTVDAIALKAGHERTAPARLRAGVMHTLREMQERKGDCWSYRADLIQAALDALRPTGYSSDEVLVVDALDDLIRSEKLTNFEVEGPNVAIADARLHALERAIQRVLIERATRANAHFSGSLEEEIDCLAPGLNRAQRAAVEAACRHSIVCITGGAGVGKTFTVSSIVAMYEERRKRIALIAPTGKAAKRLEQVVRRPAKTIHRFLGMLGRAYEEDIDARGGSRMTDWIPDVVIVDECSMVDVPLMAELLGVVAPHTAIVLVGDHNQLPPIGPGCVLRDIVQRQPIYVAVLDEVMRQSGPLKLNATAILEGHVSDSVEAVEIDDTRVVPWAVVSEDDEEYVAGYIAELYRNMLEEDFGYDPRRDVQVLTPQKGTALGTKRLNAMLQQIAQEKFFGVSLPEPEYDEETDEVSPPQIFVGDKVIHTVNNYDLGVMNGTVGEVLAVERGRLVVQHEDRQVVYTPDVAKAQLELAYALTIHKYQGSEIPCAIVVMHSAHSYMHNKNLFYTAVTRAKKTAIIVGQYDAMNRAAKKPEAERRKTFLSVAEYGGR